MAVTVSMTVAVPVTVSMTVAVPVSMTVAMIMAVAVTGKSRWRDQQRGSGSGDKEKFANH